MELTPKQKKTLKISRWISYGFSFAIFGLTLAMVGYVCPPAIKEIKQQRYAITHLDKNAISQRENPFPVNNFSSWGGVVYKDLDGDGDYESILERKNSDGKFVDIPMKKGLDGKIEFLKLSDTAIDPLNIPDSMQINYQDINNDGKLESITRLYIQDKSYNMNIEKVDNKYILSPTD